MQLSTLFATLPLLTSNLVSATPINVESRGLSVDGFNWVGTYSEPSILGFPWRALTGNTTSSYSMTIETCSKFCTGWNLFGVEGGSQCYCGNVLSWGSVLEPLPIDQSCAGNFLEQCGGVLQLGLFLKSGCALTTAAASTSTTAVATTSTSNTAVAVKTTSCSTASSSTKASAVSSSATPAKSTIASSALSTGTTTSTSASATSTSTSTPTVSTLNSASSNSTSASISSTPTLTSASSTATPTSASSTPTPTYVQSAGGFSYAGCAAEPFYNGVENTRALTGSSTSSSNMTVEACAAFCISYTYFGVEYSTQCYCGDSFGTGTTQDSTLSDCTYVCGGSNTEYCGGSGHFNVYQQPNGTATSLPTSIPSASAASSAGGYDFVTCAVEPMANGGTTRALIDLATVNSTGMSVEYCASFCQGYNYFGVEYSSECYCGNAIQNGTTQDTTNGCDYACNGNNAEECGGSWRLDLYELSSLPNITLPLTWSAPAATSTSSAATIIATSVLATITPVSSGSTAIATSTSTSTSTSTPSTAPTTLSTSTTSTSAPGTTLTTLSTSSATKSTTSISASTVTTVASNPSATGIYNPSSCPSFNSTLGAHGTYTFSLYHQQNALTLNPSNPSNPTPLLFPPYILSLSPSKYPNVCSAAQACVAQIGCSQSMYESFDLHWRTDKSAWECVLYEGVNTLGSYFNVQNSVVGNGYGFSGVACGQ